MYQGGARSEYLFLAVGRPGRTHFSPSSPSLLCPRCHANGKPKSSSIHPQWWVVRSHRPRSCIELRQPWAHMSLSAPQPESGSHVHLPFRSGKGVCTPGLCPGFNMIVLPKLPPLTFLWFVQVTLQMSPEVNLICPGYRGDGRQSWVLILLPSQLGQP